MIPSPITLVVNDMSASRGGKVVVAGLSFRLQPGEAISLRGENGTGKTSALRAIAGFSQSAPGAIRFFRADSDADSAEIRATSIHWLGGGDGIADKLTVRENLRFWAGLYGGMSADIPSAIERLEIGHVLDRPAGKLSTGQRRRLGVGRLLICPRPIWLLDEPMSGLDDTGRALLLDIIASHRASGGIAVMATHEEGLPGAPTLRLQTAVMS